MFTPLTISGLVVGLVFLLAGATLIVLSYATKVFYTKTKFSKAAGESMINGSALVAQADVAWDETGIVLDSTGMFLKWTSTKLYSDTEGGTPYSYDLVKPKDLAVITTRKSDSGLTGIYLTPLRSYNYVTNMRTSTQTWASFPACKNNTTVVIAFSCSAPSIGANSNGDFTMYVPGMSFWHEIDSTNVGHRYFTFINNQLSCNQMSLTDTTRTLYSSSPIENIKTYPTASYGTITGNVSAFQYTSSTNEYMTYFNGMPKPLTTNIIPPMKTTTAVDRPKLYVGRTTLDVFSGTIHAIYVFSRVLSALEVDSVSSCLQQKYFGVAEVLNKNGVMAPNISLSVNSVFVHIGDSISSPIPSNTGGEITGFSIAPLLSDPGLTFNTTTGVISGIPTMVKNTTFTITASNDGGPANATLQLQVNGKEFKNKYVYIGAGGAAVAAGAALAGTACFYGLDWKSSRVQVPSPSAPVEST